MTTVECPCGKACMTYEVVGEDMWTGTAVNTKLAYNDNWGRTAFVNSAERNMTSLIPAW